MNSDFNRRGCGHKAEDTKKIAKNCQELRKLMTKMLTKEVFKVWNQKISSSDKQSAIVKQKLSQEMSGIAARVPKIMNVLTETYWMKT